MSAWRMKTTKLKQHWETLKNWNASASNGLFKCQDSMLFFVTVNWTDLEFCSVHRTKQVGGELGFITPREFLMTAELHSLITSQYITGQERHKDPLRLVYGYTSINNDGEWPFNYHGSLTDLAEGFIRSSVNLSEYALSEECVSCPELWS